MEFSSLGLSCRMIVQKRGSSPWCCRHLLQGTGQLLFAVPSLGHGEQGSTSCWQGFLCFLLARSSEAFPGPAQGWVQKSHVRPEKEDEFVTRSIILDLIAWGKEAACSVLAAHSPLGLSTQSYLLTPSPANECGSCAPSPSDEALEVRGCPGGSGCSTSMVAGTLLNKLCPVLFSNQCVAASAQGKQQCPSRRNLGFSSIFLHSVEELESTLWSQIDLQK